MRKRTIWASALAAATLAIGLATPPANATPVATAVASSPDIDQLVAQLPAMREQAAATRARLGIDDSPLREATLNAIDPTRSTSAPPPHHRWSPRSRPESRTGPSSSGSPRSTSCCSTCR